MTNLLRDLHGVVVMMDGILVKCRETQSNAVLRTVKQSWLKSNEAKCHFGKSELCFFGHIISAGGVRPDSSKVRAITEMPSLTNVRELLQMLEPTSYLGKFLSGLSTILHPVT